MCGGYAIPLMWYGRYHTSTFPLHLELHVYACIIELTRAKLMFYFEERYSNKRLIFRNRNVLDTVVLHV
jgi:hypothetical protein